MTPNYAEHNGSGYEWLRDSLANYKLPSETLQRVIQLLRNQDIYSRECFLELSSADLNDLLQLQPLSIGLRTAIKGTHKAAQS